MIFNIHGYGGNPENSVRNFLRENGDFGEKVVSFDYPSDPAQAWALMRRDVAQVKEAHQRTTIFGNSLGGFFATALAVDLGATAIVINPALRPWDTLRQVDPALTDDYLARFRPLAHELNPRAISYDFRNILVVLGAQDEVLDYREALAHFSRLGSEVLVHPDGGHHGVDLAPFTEQIARYVHLSELEGISPE